MPTRTRASKGNGQSVSLRKYPMSDSNGFVFVYFDGEKVIHGDPIMLHRWMLGHAEGKLGQLIEDVRNDDQSIAFPAIEKMLDVARKTFDLVPYDRETGKGAMEHHVN